ncbi:MAG: lysine biosynthesis protein LysX [Nitrososphaeria archaeon]|nr:lysine biosynthesis protein LysX [Nitrososphaeria archaeon]
MVAEVELIFDVPRFEEKLIVDALRKMGLNIKLTNVKYSPLTWDEAPAPLSLIRTISMQRAVYSASLREAVGVKTINCYRAILIAGDKILTLSELKKNGIPFPESLVAFNPEAAEKAGEALGYPLVDKPPIGSWGRLVTLVKDHQALKTVIEHREFFQSQVIRTHLIQRYVNGGDRDLRILVLGEEVLGGMRRIAGADEWRSNVARGGKVETIKLGDELVELALKVAKVIDGEFIGIDFFEENGRYLVNEVNGVPEFKGFMEATRVNVPEKLANHVKLILRK